MKEEEYMWQIITKMQHKKAEKYGYERIKFTHISQMKA